MPRLPDLYVGFVLGTVTGAIGMYLASYVRVVLA